MKFHFKVELEVENINTKGWSRARAVDADKNRHICLMKDVVTAISKHMPSLPRVVVRRVYK